MVAGASVLYYNYPMVTIYKIAPLKRYGVIIKGPLKAAVEAAGIRSSHPLRNVHVNAYGSIHADFFGDTEIMHEWFAATHDRGPGALLFYIGK